jgi:hypothetical protein
MEYHNGSDKRRASVHQILCDDATFLSRIITGDENGFTVMALRQSNEAMEK